MVPQHAFVALLSFVVAANAQSSTISSTRSSFTSAFWTYTSRYAAIASPTTYSRYSGGVTTATVTVRSRTVKPTATPSGTPTSTRIYMSAYADLQVVYEYYGVNAVAESDLVPERDSLALTTTDVSTIISFSMPVTLTAPASCPTPFTITSTASVSVPSQVWDQLKPSSTTARGITTRGSGYVYSYQTWYLTAGAAPYESNSDIYYSLYIASCSTPPPSRVTGSPRSGGDDDSSSGSGSRSCYRSSYYYCGTPLKIYIIIIASVIPGLFLLGLLESWFWFRRLMMGKSAMRFGTVCWVCISLWVMCFTRMQNARNPEDQKLLQEKWKNMGAGASFKAWMKWGFRHKYPVEHLGQYSKLAVGVVPEGQPIHPAMTQVPPGFVPGAPPPGAPPAPGQAFYYGHPPAGWVPTPDGQALMPPQGYYYPPPQQAGYYGEDVSKTRSMASSSPVSALGPQQPAQPQAPQPVYPTPGNAQMPAPSPPPQNAAPPPPSQQVGAPPAHVSEAPANPAQKPPNAP
ncbi:hypothetical protein GQ44DRAFT_776516 [Phaeosphaeriaceae sp. PMI808]|nr:hypothetical protein GQ44DRAFT_776516 [Phaeosphaeriaceae sp. PMI808]